MRCIKLGSHRKNFRDVNYNDLRLNRIKFVLNLLFEFGARKCSIKLLSDFFNLIKDPC